MNKFIGTAVMAVPMNRIMDAAGPKVTKRFLTCDSHPVVVCGLVSVSTRFACENVMAVSVFQYSSRRMYRSKKRASAFFMSGVSAYAKK